MDHKEFIKNALRTESVVDKLNVDRKILMDTLSMFILTTEMLDAIKKKAFYNNSKKYDEIYNDMLGKIVSVSYSIGYNYERIKEGIYEEELVEDVNTRIAHGVIGIASEAGELVECMLKAMENNESIDYVNLAEELFDADWYKSVITDECDINWEKEWQKIIDKLRARFGEKYSDEKANNRNKELERKILESE